MIKEFVAFLKEYKIVSLAIAFVMGSASTALVNSLVKDVVMPLLGPVMPGETWEETILNIGPAQIAIGSFGAEILNFVILALVVFLVVKKLMKQEEKEDAKKG